MIKKIILLLILPVWLSANTSGSFLALPNSGMEAALAGAISGLDNNISAASYNPAGLTGFNGFGFSVLYNKQLFDNTFIKASVAHLIGFGMLAVNFAFCQIPFAETYQFGLKNDAQALNHLYTSLAFQKDIIKNLSTGISVKFISMDLGDKSAATAGGDIGLLYQINRTREQHKLNIGAGLRNWGLGLKFDMETQPLPRTVFFGVLYQPLAAATLFLEADAPADLDPEFAAGVQASLFDIFKPRVGYRYTKNRQYLTAGMGLRKDFGSSVFEFDYALSTQAEQTHLIELKIKRPAFYDIERHNRIPYDGKNPSRIAVNEFTTMNADKGVLAPLAEWLRSDLSAGRALIVLARENMDQILKEQTVQLSGATDEKTALTLGKILNVQYLITGTINKTGGMYYITVKVINVENGKIETSVEESADGAPALRIAVKNIAVKLLPEVK